MKIKQYLVELSLAILGVLIALFIDNLREDWRDTKLVNSYLDVVVDDLNFDIINMEQQLKLDSSWTKEMQVLRDIFVSNPDLPELNYGLDVWTKGKPAAYRKLNTWDSLDYYIFHLYSNTGYKTRKVGFSIIVNSGLSHQLRKNLLQKINIYYTTDSDDLDNLVNIDNTCMWNAIPYLNKYQGRFKEVILNKDFDATLIRNEATGRLGTVQREMAAKVRTIAKARTLIQAINASR
ncbi:MAG: hypothetical protein JSU09_05205 [Bacteroidetes bacterium]|nr:hypothetical protein [Bacteroidota bacterium]